MISIDITERLWDAVRPGSVKKTGLNEAVRTATKALAKNPDTPKAFADADDAVVALKKAIDDTAVVVKKASDDKRGAAAKLNAWGEQCEQARKDSQTQRTQTGLLKAVNQVDAKLQEKLADVRKALVDAKALTRDLESGKLTDTRAAAVGLQKLRAALRSKLDGEVRQEFQPIASEEWNMIMVAFHETSEQMAEVHRQVQRVVRLSGDSSAEAKLVAEPLYKAYEREMIEQRNKFSS